ncbi:hypothetical protein ACF0H5_016889 [Mactra antiquata]
MRLTSVRCLDRLRESRDKLKARFRKLPTSKNNDMFIEELMKTEWDTLRKEHEKGFKELDVEANGDLDLNIDQILDMFDDIQSELRQEEIRMLEEYSNYEESLQLEEECLCSAIHKLSTEEVICPLCKKHTLLTNKSVIFCQCGLRINTEQDCLTLTNVQQMLDLGLKQHSEKCESEPVFSVVVEVGTSNLLMTCPDCDWMSVVI